MNKLIKTYKYIRNKIFKMITILMFKYYKVDYKEDFKTNGIPIIKVSKQGQLKIGFKLSLNNGYFGNQIGRQQPCIISVSSGAVLIVGNNVGISSTAIISTKKITIGDNVRIGGNTCIYDTDFHSLYSDERISIPEIISNVKKAEVKIEDNVFIGGHSTILKGVNIGVNSIIGACSVVTKDIPPNEIWAGNPAKFISKVPLKE